MTSLGRLEPRLAWLVLRLDSFGGTEYAGLHGVSSSVIRWLSGVQVPQLVARRSASQFATHAHPGGQTPLSPTTKAILTRCQSPYIDFMTTKASPLKRAIKAAKEAMSPQRYGVHGKASTCRFCGHDRFKIGGLRRSSHDAHAGLCRLWPRRVFHEAAKAN